jgi:hypothetical protein
MLDRGKPTKSLTGDQESRRLGGILAQKGSVLFAFHHESLLISYSPGLL